ncbi:hypothetical protein FNV43_RR06599 [Rhamnella rubrinervis]|uniref:GDSL esterase/lipase n=1 Tax=Rhamnella rubrinervis TaxID=2594499 RepID=A0A8K0MLJ6_9ROSA|nr:hypothetical protein FNV43_RR06599 [Rhamnella rubrinervis]
MWAVCGLVALVLGLWSGIAGLQSLARADYLPYGIDFGGPTGRFSNGKTTVDVIAQLLGFDNYIPPYVNARGQDILKGVNYASAAAGIREETGRQLGGRISFSGQILHDYGARKFVLFGVGQIGLKSLVDQFNSNTPDSKFIYIDSYGIFQDIINSPATFGFRVTNTGCCGVGRNNGQITCLPLQTPCQNRDEYLFWDAFHPTEAGNTVVGRRAYSAQRPSDAYPIDIRRLAQL